MFHIKTKEEKQYELEQKRARARLTISECLSSKQGREEISLLEIEALLDLIREKATRVQFRYNICGHITATEDIPIGTVTWSRGVGYIEIRLGDKFVIHNVTANGNIRGRDSELIMGSDGKAHFKVTNYWNNGSHTCSLIATF